jgi:hypothetical protein
MGRNLLAVQHCSRQWPVHAAARLRTVHTCGPLAEPGHSVRRASAHRSDHRSPGVRG